MVFDKATATLRVKWDSGKITVNCKEFFPCRQEKAKRFFTIAFHDPEFDFETVDALLSFFHEYAVGIQSSIRTIASMADKHVNRVDKIKTQKPRRGTELYREYMRERGEANECNIQARAQYARLRMLMGNRDLLAEMRGKYL